MSWKSFILKLLLPQRCLFCQKSGSILCSDCFRKLKFNKNYKKHNSFLTPNLNQVFIAGDYNDFRLASLIKKFKYSFISILGPILAQFLIIFWNNLKLDYPQFFLSESKEIIVIPLPLSKKRQSWRGFNQSKILAQEFSKTFNYSLNKELIRTKNRPSQTSLNKNEREKNIKNVFSWTGNSLQEKTLILIDDVLTTGASLNEAARILRQEEKKKIYALVLASG